jgi:hypothetical protein
MDATKQAQIATALQLFAEEHLHAGFFAHCMHVFTRITCDQCPGLTLQPRLERHPGDRPGDFCGLLHVTCAGCGRERCAAGVTIYGQENVQPIAIEHPTCRCGGRSFYLGQCERWDDGFFDEGTVVAQCVACGTLRVLLDTD